MGDALWFIEGPQSLMASDQAAWSSLAEAWGLGGLLGDSSPPEFLRVMEGPGGGPGLLLRFGLRVKPVSIGPSGKIESPKRRGLRFEPEAQEWRRRPEGAGLGGGASARQAPTDIPLYPPSKGDPEVSPPSRGSGAADDGVVWWAGWWRDSPPGPEAFARDRQASGASIELRDGNAWKVPSLGNLPRVFGCDESGEQSMQVSARYRPLEVAAEAVDDVQFPCAKGVLLGLWWEVAVAALGGNYRVDEHWIRCLELLDTEALLPVFAAVKFGNRWREGLKALAIEEVAPGAPRLAEAEG